MKQVSAVLLAFSMFTMPFATQAAGTSPEVDDNYPYYLAAGAVGGVILFNFITGGVEALPFMTSSSSLWEGPMAVNRVFTGLSVALGMLAVDWSYKNLDVKKHKLNMDHATSVAP